MQTSFCVICLSQYACCYITITLPTPSLSLIHRS